MFLDELHSLFAVEEIKCEIWIMVFPLFKYIVYNLGFIFMSKENAFWDHFNDSKPTYTKTL